MARQLKGLVYFLMTNMRFSIGVFWTVLLIFLVLSLGVAYFLIGVEDGMFAFGFPFATYINSGIVGFVVVNESIPFALKRGAVRKNIFIATGIFFLGYAFIMAFISSLLQSIVTAVTDAVNLHTFHFLHPAQLIANDTFLTRIVIDTAMMFTILIVFYALGLLFYRGGLLAGGSVVGLFGVILLFGIAQGFLFNYLRELYETIDMVFFAQVFGVGVLVYGITYFLVRRITTVKVR